MCVYMFLNKYIYVANINKKEAMILKAGKKENIGGLVRRKGKDEMLMKYL